jgi:type 1 glutamine amidotransferase
LNVNRRNALAGAMGLGLGALAAPAIAQARPQVLVFWKATGYRHPSIEPGIEMLRAIAEREGYDITSTEDPEVFSAANMPGFDALVLLCSTTDAQKAESEWLQGSKRDALQAFVRSGKGVVGIHAAADSHHHWPYYGQMIGGYFDRHPAFPNVRPGVLRVVDRTHESTRELPEVIERQDEWYLYRDFNPLVNLLIAADVGSVYTEGSDPIDMQWFTTQTNTNTRLRMPEVNPKPLAWWHEFETSRVFYTGMGHTPETFAEPMMATHVGGGLRWALRRERRRRR